MVKRVDKLTPEQEARFGEWTKKWIDIGLSTKPADFERFNLAVEKAYEFANKKWHNNIVIVDNPLVMALSAPIADYVLNNIYKNKGGAVRDAVDGAVGGAVDGAVDGAVRGAVDGAVGGAVDGAVRDAVDGVRKNILNKYYNYLWGQFSVGGWWYGNAYVTFMRDVCNLELDGDLWDRASCYEDINSSVSLWYPHSHFIMVCQRPYKINRDDEGRLHCENGASIAWKDFELYHWHGVKVPAHWINDRKNLTAIEVLKIENTEQRAAGAEIVGWGKIESELGAKVIHDSGNTDIGSLIEMTLPGIDEKGRFLKAWCPRNGFIYEGVPHVSDIDGLPINTALAAQAWRVGDPVSEYVHPMNRT